MGRKLLVTGGAGFIGSNFVHHWLAGHRDDTVVVLDALTYAGVRENLAALASDPRLQLVVGDICDERLVGELFERERIDVVVHFAAESHVDRSLTGPDAFIKTNIVGTHTLLKFARQAWHGAGGWRAGTRFHHVSTDEVYGSLGPDDPAFTEQTPYAPSSPYSASKAASDHLVRAYAHSFGLPTTISNCSNNYGPFHLPEKLIPLMITNALDGARLPIYGVGANIRDWLFVLDHCEAIERIIERGRPGATYNVGGNCERRNVDIVGSICTLLDQRFDEVPELKSRFPACPAAAGRACEELITNVADRPGHDFRYAVGTELIERELGWRPRHAFEDGIRHTVDWYLSNEAWWRAAKSRMRGQG